MSKERKRIIKNLDKYWSLYVRMRDGRCVTCEQQGIYNPVTFNDQGHPNNHDNGHYLSRLKYTTRWEEDNQHCQCKGCNMKHNLNPLPYTRFMLRRYGQERIDELEKLYYTQKKYGIIELKEMLAIIKDKYNELLCNMGEYDV